MSNQKSPGIQLLLLTAITVGCLLTGQILSAIFLISLYGDALATATVDPADMLIASAIVHACTHLLTFIIFLRIAGLKAADLLPKAAFRWWTLLLIPPLLIGGIAATSFLSEASYSFFEINAFYTIIEDADAQQKALIPILDHNNPGLLFLSLFVLAVLPAIGEEFIYRAILQTRIQQATGSIHYATIICAFLFSALHWQPVNLLGIACMGIILGYLYWWTKNIWVSVAFHFLFNASQIVMIYFWPGIESL